MSKLKRNPEIKTRLNTEDHQRFVRLVLAKNAPPARLVREALLEYLDRQEAETFIEAESIYAQQLKGSTNRICAMLYKTGLDARTLINFFSAIDPGQKELLGQCRISARKQLSMALSEEERAEVIAMSKKVAGGG